MKLLQALMHLLKKFGINANKIELSANDILNLLAGNEINMKSRRITLKSDNFSVDSNGNMTCSNANILGGKINLSSNVGETRIKVTATNATTQKEVRSYIRAGDFSVNVAQGKEAEGLDLIWIGTAVEVGINNHISLIDMINEGDDDETKLYAGGANFWEDGMQTYVGGTHITTPVLNQTSLAEQKKNFEKLENALEIIKNVDIYKYNLKNEKDGTKKHIGFVIGDKYRYSKELTSQENDGVDLYSLASCCLKGIKEQQEQIEQLKNELKEIKEGN